MPRRSDTNLFHLSFQHRRHGLILHRRLPLLPLWRRCRFLLIFVVSPPTQHATLMCLPSQHCRCFRHQHCHSPSSSQSLPPLMTHKCPARIVVFVIDTMTHPGCQMWPCHQHEFASTTLTKSSPTRPRRWQLQQMSTCLLCQIVVLHHRPPPPIPSLTLPFSTTIVTPPPYFSYSSLSSFSLPSAPLNVLLLWGREERPWSIHREAGGSVEFPRKVFVVAFST